LVRLRQKTDPVGTVTLADGKIAGVCCAPAAPLRVTVEEKILMGAVQLPAP
jgi:hypothetical protein